MAHGSTGPPTGPLCRVIDAKQQLDECHVMVDERWQQVVEESVHCITEVFSQALSRHSGPASTRTSTKAPSRPWPEVRGPTAA
jgi:hypothetical protein